MTPQSPQLHSRATLSDLMDRLLDRGLFLRADLVISVAGIPLIGASLSLALAGMETMLKYGVLNDMDREMRAEIPSPLPSPGGGGVIRARCNA